MKYLLASAILCLCVHHAGLAQKLEMPRRSCLECEITKSYDPFLKSTVVLLKLMPVAEVKDGTMYFSLASSHRVDPPGIRKVVTFSITFIAKQLIEAKDPVLRAQADNDAINFGRLAHSRTDLKISSYEGLVPWADVVKIGKSKNVEMSFDGITFKLTDEHQAAIVDFLAYAAGEP